MISQTISCDKCIHNKVCSITKQVKDTVAKVSDIFGEDNPYVDIYVRCHHYDQGNIRTKRSEGFD